jgi:hypothetical protein
LENCFDLYFDEGKCEKQDFSEYSWGKYQEDLHLKHGYRPITPDEDYKGNFGHY